MVVDQVNKSFNSITSVEVEGSFCNVNITSQAGDVVSLTGELKADKQRDDVKIRYSESNNVLKVWIDRPNSLMGNFDGRLELKVLPTQTSASTTRPGSVDVSNIGMATVSLKQKFGKHPRIKNAIRYYLSNIVGEASLSKILVVCLKHRVRRAVSTLKILAAESKHRPHPEVFTLMA